MGFPTRMIEIRILHRNWMRYPGCLSKQGRVPKMRYFNINGVAGDL